VGIRETKTVYVSDRNQEFFLDQMETSHLLNAIAHHRKQMETITWIIEESRHSTPWITLRMAHQTFLIERESKLRYTIAQLAQELASRSVNEDDLERGDYASHGYFKD